MIDWTLKLRAAHRVRNLAPATIPTGSGTTTTVPVRLPTVTRTASVLLRATARDSAGFVRVRVDATDRDGITVASTDLPTEVATTPIEWRHTVRNLPPEATGLAIVLTGTTAAPTVHAAQVTADVRAEWLPTPAEWTDVTGDVLSISSRRGGEGRGAVFTPEAGHLSVTLKGDWSHLPGGTEVEWTANDGQYIFPPCRISDFELDDNRKAGTVNTAITAHDDIETLSNTPRYGLIVPDRGQDPSITERDGPWQGVTAQVAQLLQSSPVPLEFEVHDPLGARLRSEQSEQSLAGHITMAARSTAASWCQRRDGKLIVRNPWEFVVLNALLSDDDVHADTPGVDHYCYTDLRMGAGTKDLVNTVTVDNFGGRVPDPEEAGGYRWQTVPHGPYANEVSIAQWGPRSESLETCIHITSDVRPSAAADGLLAVADPSPAPRSVTLNAKHGWRPGLDILDPIRVRNRRRTYEAYITAVENQLSAGTHLITYDLARRAADPQED